MRATVNGVSTDYAYDTAGNIRSKTGHSYEYNNPQWLDQLTAYDSGEITYDECGNPLEYYNGSTFTWTQGRKLESANVSGTSISYTYDMAGVRSGKTVGGTSYSFTTLSGLVTRQTWGDSAIDFVYDENNQPLAMRYNGTWYYYVLNLQGDVVKLVRSDGAIVASYSYDPWGKVLTSSGSLAEINPLRYRGYYYDTETGFYYLQSRYYDPEIGRFINADSYATTDAAGLLSTNMYAYCENDPVNGSDPNGEWVHILVGGVLGAATSFATSLICGESIDSALKSAAWGAASGALSAAFPGAGAVISVGMSVAESIVNDCSDNKAAGTVIANAITTAMFSTIIGSRSSYITSEGAWDDIYEVVKTTAKRTTGNHPKIKRPSVNFAKKVKNRSVVSVLGGTLFDLLVGKTADAVKKAYAPNRK